MTENKLDIKPTKATLVSYLTAQLAFLLLQKIVTYPMWVYLLPTIILGSILGFALILVFLAILAGVISGY